VNDDGEANLFLTIKGLSTTDPAPRFSLTVTAPGLNVTSTAPVEQSGHEISQRYIFSSSTGGVKLMYFRVESSLQPPDYSLDAGPLRISVGEEETWLGRNAPLLQQLGIPALILLLLTHYLATRKAR
jgi:hypothetical protein